jgi:N utilization substance protein B
MGTRRKAREFALRVLFETDFNQERWQGILERVLSEETLEPETREFLSQILTAYGAHVQEIDAHIETHSDNWKISRMASVDRNLLRLGVCEILFLPEVPKSVSINEYLEIAKKFGSEDSSSFINGILDRLEKTK